MTQADITFKPTLSFLSQPDKNKIHNAVLEVLNDVGMRILHPDALALLRQTDCIVSDDGMVRIPAKIVEQALESAPSTIAVYDRTECLVMDLGGRRSYFGTGSDLIYALDSEDGRRHQCRLEDVQNAARLSDALTHIDFIMSFAHPSEIKPQRAYLASFQAMADNSVKPIVCTAEGRHDLEVIWKIARIIRGSEDALRTKPYFIHYAEPISPLKHPFNSLDKLLFCAEKGIPLIYSPAPIAGSTAPITLAGHVIQGLAECFCGLVIHQLKAAGAPFLMGMGPAVLDMATGECSYNAPEYLLAYMAAIEMSHYYDLPNWGYAGTSDSQIPDQQAAFESGLLSFMAAFAGSNLNHDVGYIDFGRTGSLGMIVIGDEIISQVRRMLGGVPLDEDNLALDVIREIGPDGHFITHDHTLTHLRSTQWRPDILNRHGFEKWEADGRLTLHAKAMRKVQAILDSHKPLPISADKAQAIQKLVDQF